jgi:DNA polymerase III subunit epsilon
MKVVGVDIETTGLDQAKGHRIIEIAMITAEVDFAKYGEVKVVESYVQQVNPLRGIDPEAEAVHKIPLSSLLDKPHWEDVAPQIAERIRTANVLVAHNMAFDGPFIAAELMRIGIMPPVVPVFCTMENARWATGPGKLPKLSELAWSLGVDYDHKKAHAAEYDVLVTLQCLRNGGYRNLYQIPTLVAAKEAA